MKKLIFLMACLLMGHLHSFAGQEKPKYIKAQIDLNTITISQLRNLGIFLDHGTKNSQNFFTGVFSEKDKHKLIKNNIAHTVLINDLSQFYKERNKRDSIHMARFPSLMKKLPDSLVHYKEGSMGGFLTLDEAMAEIDSMKILFPNLISVKKEIGKSVENRPLHIIKISDNPEVDENEPELFINALHHAREPIGIQQLVYFMWYLLEKYSTDAEVKYFVDNLEFYFLPCVNPDGYVFNEKDEPNGGGLWRKNRSNNSDGSKGVDLNRTYSVGWGLNSGSSNNPRAEDYRGTEAFSQPETRAVRDFMLGRNIIMTLNYHSWENGLIYPYAYQLDHYPAEIDFIRKLGRDLTRDNNFILGSTSEILDYLISGDASDWQHDHTGSYSYLPEVGNENDDFWPPRSRIPVLIDASLSINLMMAGYALPPVIESAQNDTLKSAFVYTLKYKAEGLPDTPELQFKSLDNLVTIDTEPKTYSFTSQNETFKDSVTFSFDPNQLQHEQTVDVEVTKKYHKFSQVDTLSFKYYNPDLSLDDLNLGSYWNINLTSEYADLQYQLPTGFESTLLSVINVTGNVVHQQKLDPNNRALRMDTHKWGRGLFYFVVKNSKTVLYKTKALKLN